MNARKTGLAMVVVGSIATVVGLVLDAFQHADDPTLAQREGIFDLGSLSHATFFAGICVAVFGLVLMLLAGTKLYATSEGGVSVGRRFAQVMAPAAAVVLIGACATAAGNSSLAEPGASADGAQATSADGHTHDDGTGTDGTAAGEDHGHGPVIEGTATGTSPCEIASPTPASPGQVGTGEGGDSEAVLGEHGSRGMIAQSPLTKAEREELEEQMAAARTVVEKYPTAKDAEAAGYRMSTAYVPCIGAHYTNMRLVIGFNPAAPSEILYDGTGPDAQIVGLSYLTYSPGGPPEGFAGGNDHWHQHNANGGLCFGGPQGAVIGGEEMTEAECTEIGGVKRELTDIWMAHAWVVPGFECSWGVFAGECPELGGRTGGTAWDQPADA